MFDLQAIYHASDLVDRANAELDTAEPVIRMMVAKAKAEASERQLWMLAAPAAYLVADIPRFQDSESYPSARLQEMWQLKVDLEGVLYQYDQAQMAATGLKPYQWTMDAHSPILNVRATIQNTVARAEGLLASAGYVGRDANQPRFTWNLESVRKETFEAAREGAGEILKPPSQWAWGETLAVIGIAVSVLLFLWRK